MRLEERFTLVTPNVIDYEVTIEDPNTFTSPWRIAMPLYRRMEPNMQLLEFRCQEFAEEFMYGHLRKEPLVTRWESATMDIEVTRKIPEGGRVLRVVLALSVLDGRLGDRVRALAGQ